MRKLLYLASVSLISIVLLVPVVSAQTQRGPEIDVLRVKALPADWMRSIAITGDLVDVVPSWSIPMDVTSGILAEENEALSQGEFESLVDMGYTVLENLGYHIGFIGFNIRDTATIRSYYRSEIVYWPLHDAEFRHALVHCFDQQSLIPTGTMMLNSLVPPAQSRYYNHAIPQHPYNPGDPFMSPAGEHSTCGILKEAGYTFVDRGTIGIVDDWDYWKNPDGTYMPNMEIWTPLMEVHLTSYVLGAEFVEDLSAVGLAGTTANGGKGLINIGRDFNDYISDVYDFAAFDAYMAFYGLDRLPGQLYSFLHTNQDCLTHPGRRNAVGVNDPTIDALSEMVKHSLDIDGIRTGAEAIQEMMYTPGKTVYPNADNFALSYMMLYSKSYYNAYDPNLEGIVKSTGYGSDNDWTFLNINWKPGYERVEDGKTVVIWTIGMLDSFNPLYADTKHEWEILGRAYDGLANINPYQHGDISWLAEGWTITETASGMDIDFVLSDTAEWQDGKPFTAYDVEFCLEFLRDYQVPKYAETWQILDVVVTDATHVKVVCNEAGIDLFYDYAGLAALLPEHIWDRFGDPSDPMERQAVLDYDPNVAYNVAPGYVPGPHPTPTNLFGTGPFVFQFWDSVNQYGDMWRNTNYFKSTDEIHTLKTDMFHEAGDVNEDGVVDVLDMQIISFSYGYFVGEPNYNPEADIVEAPFVVDIKDMSMAGFYLGWKREYP